MTIQTRSARTVSLIRRRVSSRPALLVAALTVLAVVAFGVIVYFVGTSVTWFASSPTSDRVFGNLNQCLIRALPDARSGFAVAVDGKSAAAFDGSSVAICRSDAAAKDGASMRKLDLPGATRAAWDFDGNLWIATASSSDRSARLWRIAGDGDPVAAGELAAVALAGHARGVVALDADGKLVSVGADGSTLGFSELPRATPEGARLTSDVSGKLVAVEGGGGVFVFAADSLERVRAEAPCDVEYLWWTREPETALLSCGPRASWALVFRPVTGTQEEAPKRTREQSVLVPRAGIYVRGCDALPCEASAP